MKNLIKIFTITLLFTSCFTNSSKNKILDLDRKDIFRKFIGQFKILSLPIQINTLEINTAGLSPGNQNSIDTLFINDQAQNCFYYGILPDTSDNFKLLYIVSADIYIPVITIFSKDGKNISSKDLYVQDCGESGIVCGYTCNMSVTIFPDNSIYSVDSTFTSLCDSITETEIPNTTDTTIAFMKGTIDNQGNIIFSDMIKNKLAKN
jgi:hypothetical protein